MDIDLAIWMYSSTSAYRLDVNKRQIEEWRDSVIPAPTSQQLTDAWTAFQKALVNPISLVTNKTAIQGDDQDTATITITQRLPLPETLTVWINDTPYDVTLSPASRVGERSGVLDITSPSPGGIIVITATITTPEGQVQQTSVQVEVI